MTIKVKDSGGTLRTVTRASVMVGGVLKPLKSVKVVDSTGTLRTVFSGLTVTVNYSSVTSFGTTEPLITSPTAVVTASGGTAPYTYAWTLINDDLLGTTVASASTSNSTTFSSTALNNFIPHVTLWRCTVTDSGGVTGSVDVTVTATKTGGIIP